MSYLKRIRIWVLGMSMMLCAGCSRKTILLETGELLARETEPIVETEYESEYKKEELKALIYVYVCGQVVSPGVYTMTDGDRMYQAIDMAGGILPEGDAGPLNLASLLYDGQKIYVPSYEETEVTGDGTSWQDFSSADERQDHMSECVNINQASKDELMDLPGIGASKAEAIIRYRQEYGQFHSVEELMQVPGIKEGTYAQIKDRISIN